MPNSVAQIPNSVTQMPDFESIRVDSSILVTTIRFAVKIYTGIVLFEVFHFSSSQLKKMLVLDLTSFFKERNRIYIKGFHKLEQNSAFCKTFAAIFVLFTWYPGFLATMPDVALSMT